ncbi:MAG TPA: NCS2 family permease, partial [Candidatus Ruania gallistercoris]|nr:NCS2 family permease [Candidatus Ruania gallistercoris]
MSTPSPATAEPRGPVDRLFKITERGSSLGREIRGGLVTFFAMSYIIVLNPLIIGTVADGSGSFIGGDPDQAVARVAAATALVAGVMCILMGVVANFPIALAAGLGLNAVVAFSIAVLPEVTWADAMGLVVIEGIVILILVLTGFREAVFRAVPKELRTAISVGIGLFIALIGLVDAGIVRIPASQATPVELGVGGSLVGWPSLVFVIGLLAAIILYLRKVRGALLIAIVGATVLAIIVEAVAQVGGSMNADGSPNDAGWRLNVPALPDQWVQL